MGLRFPLGLRALGSSAVGVLPGILEDAAEGGFTGQVGPLIGQRGHDARRWHVGKPRLVGHRQYRGSLFRRQGMGRRGARSIRPTIALCKAILGPPTLQGAQVNAGHLAGLAQASAIPVRHLDHLGHASAIFQRNHSSSLLWKIASSFFDSTNSAAVSARALSLRRSSRSSSLIRLWSAAVSLGLARCSSGRSRGTKRCGWTRPWRRW